MTMMMSGDFESDIVDVNLHALECGQDGFSFDAVYFVFLSLVLSMWYFQRTTHS